MPSKPEPWIAFDRRDHSRRCIVHPLSWDGARQLGAEELGIALQHVGVVACIKGETIREAITRATQ